MILSEQTDITYCKLKADSSGWYLWWSFPGPDKRYNPTVFRCSPRQVAELIDAYRSAFELFEKMKSMSKPGSEMAHDVGHFLTIRVGLGRDDAVFIQGWHNPVRNLGGLNATIRNLQKAAERGNALVSFINAGCVPAPTENAQREE